MITEERVMALFKEANPVPDADKLGVVVAGATDYLATLNQRSSEMTQVTVKENDQARNQTMLRWSVAAAVIILAGVGFVLVNQNDGGPVAAGPGPASIIEGYRLAYNAGDIDAVMAFFTEESVLSGHPFAVGENRGLNPIRRIQGQDIAAAATDNAYTISNVEVTGTTVTWDHVWTNSSGLQYCVQGHSAVVEDGKILSWTWPGGDFTCP